MRLIDADALRETMYHEAFETDTDMQKWDSGCWIRYKMFENALKNAPTIDAEHVRHGKWIKVGDNTYRCSRCNEVSCCNGNFCTDCGAKMEGEEE